MTKALDAPFLEHDYALSPGYEIIHAAKWKKLQQENIAPPDTIGLMKIRKEKLFVFNIIVGSIIKQFKKRNNGKKQLIQFSKKLGLHDSSGQEKLVELFKDLINKRILVKVEDGVLKKPTQFPYYKRGSTIGKYRIHEKLNGHEQLHAYSAFDKNKNKYIIKAYYPDKNLDKKSLQNLHLTLQREILILQYLKGSQYINQVKHYNPKKNFAVLEFFNGLSIKHITDSKVNGLNLQKCIHLISQIIEAFEFIHQHKYVHGDVHDKNILFNKNFDIQIIDFGLAMHESEESIEHLRKGGIHQFLPPERIKDDVFSYLHKNPNYTSDIYQIGIICYIILYQTYPFEAPTWKQKTKLIMQGKIKFYKKTPLGELVPEPIIEFIKSCIDIDPRKRIKNGMALNKQWKKILKQIQGMY